MWGGGMMFNEIVVQEEAKQILDEFGVRYRRYEEDYYTSDSIETVSTLCSCAAKAGVTIFNLMSVEDVMVRDNRVTGVVINWTAVEMASLHVDPLCVRSKFVIDATGHPIEVIKVIERKVDAELLTPSGKVEGEKSMWADVAERTTLENTREAFPGVYVAGMSANATFGNFRMGPILRRYAPFRRKGSQAHHAAAQGKAVTLKKHERACRGIGLDCSANRRQAPSLKRRLQIKKGRVV